MRIIRGLPKNQENAAIELLFEAFGSKFASMIGVDDKAIEVIRRSLEHQSCFVATESEQLLGVLGYQIGKKTFIHPKLRDFIDIFGRWWGIERYFRMLSMRHKTKADVLYIADIFVAAFARGKGIGTKLMDAAEQYANELGLKYLTLIVIEPNIRAKALYERYGFFVEKKQSIRPFDKIMHWDFSAIFYMRKRLD